MRTRRCKRGADRGKVTGKPGRRRSARILEPEDLPAVYDTTPRVIGDCRTENKRLHAGAVFRRNINKQPFLCVRREGLFLVRGFVAKERIFPVRYRRKAGRGQEDDYIMEEKKNSKNKKGLLAVLVLIVAVAAAAAVYMATRPAASDGDKSIVVEVVHKDGESKEFRYDTDAAYLREVLEPAGLIAGSDSEYGMFVETVDGYTADSSNEEWWCFTKDGEMLSTGVDTTPVTDGGHFEITLTVGY